MRKLVLIFLLISCGQLYALQNIEAKFGQTNAFIENHGQWSAEVDYFTRCNGYDVWFTDKAVVYDFYKFEYSEEFKAANQLHGSPLDRSEVPEIHRSGHVVNMKFANADYMAKNSGVNRRKTVYNYFLGNDSTKWATNVPLYENLKLRSIYKKIDVKYYHAKNNLRYDIIVHPGGNPDDVELEFEGQHGLEISEKGELLIHTSLGEIKNCELYTYQKINGQLINIESKFVRISDNRIGFDVAEYSEDHTLIIDPVIASTYLGGNGKDNIFDIKYFQGYVYVTGRITSSDFPTTSGAYDRYANGKADVFVSKLTDDLRTLVFSTYLGGSEDDGGTDIDINQRFIAVCGWTESADFPTSNYYEGSTDGFLTVLNLQGDEREYSEFVGGSGHDQLFRVDVNGTGEGAMCMVSGWTTSEGMSAYNDLYGIHDSFIEFITIVPPTKLGTGLFDRYFAVGNADYTYVHDVIWHGSTEIVICGSFKNRYSSDWDTFYAFTDDLEDFDIYKVSGSGDDAFYSVAKYSESVYAFFGATNSADFQTTSYANQKDYQGNIDYIITEIRLPNNLNYSSYIGGSGTEGFEEISENRSGEISYNQYDNSYYITGYTYSSDMLTTKNSIQNLNAGRSDSYFMILDKTDMNSPAYASYIGGSDYDLGWSFDFHNQEVFMAGVTSSDDMPITPNGYQRNRDMEYDGFIIKFDTLAPASLTLELGKATAKVGDVIEIPLYLKDMVNMTQSGASYIDTEIEFNSSVLLPLNYPGTDISEGMNTISLNGLPITPDDNGEIARIQFQTALGNSDYTDLVLKNYYIDASMVKIIAEDGQVNLTGICEAGGKRLVNPEAEIAILSISPQPAAENIEIKYQISEKGANEIAIVDLMGREIFNEQVNSEDPGKEKMNINLANIPTGMYYLVLKTPSLHKYKKIMIVK